MAHTINDLQTILKGKSETLTENIADMMLDESMETFHPFDVVELSSQKEVFDGAIKLSNTLNTISDASTESVFNALKNITHMALKIALEELDRTNITEDERKSAVGAHAGYSAVIGYIEELGY